jgi:60 kDa SS-A/Ro ribonucleoprotein
LFRVRSWEASNPAAGNREPGFFQLGKDNGKMSRLNNKMIHPPVRTHEGGAAVRITPEKELRRTIMSCLLWEGQFYESGVAIADRIEALAEKVQADTLSALAIEARTEHHLRHVPLLLTCCLIKKGGEHVDNTVYRVIQRADELTELLAVYWRKGRMPIPRQMRMGLQHAFSKFDEYQFAKYDRDGAVRLRDVLRIARPKPKDADQEALFHCIKNRTLATPDTWEVELSRGADKKETFERLIREGKLGYLALLRNLRNMMNSGVDEAIIRDAILARKGVHNVLPFRFVAAARAAPRLEPVLDQSLLASIADATPLAGRTAVLVDVSGSMDDKLSERSDLTRVDAAAALASVLPGDVLPFSFSNEIVACPPRKGMAGIDAILHSQRHGGTFLGAAIQMLNDRPVKADRLIVITDEQTADRVPPYAHGKGYMINVASYQNGVGYGGDWVHIDGFSEGVIRFIIEHEKSRD